ncbi:MAG: ribbon-helix-helix protein, CopG family [Deltaproteobacteria bacterium]|nr:ribbon-helix-helix protein, CopG family [Deltaproteobacteria bacterium]
MKLEKRRAGRPKVEHKKITFGFAIEEEKMDMFDALAVMNERSRSDVIRELVVGYIEKQTGLRG